MSALQEIAGNIEQYPKRIREAKEKKRYTISDIVDLSGVSKSAVSKLLDGSQMDPKLYNSVAMCMVLDLSLDELFGLDKPVDHPESMQARIHQLELENAHLSGNVKKAGRSKRHTEGPNAHSQTGYLRTDWYVRRAGHVPGGVLVY